MTDASEERRKDDMRVLERLSKVEVKVDANSAAVEKMGSTLADHVIREEEQARHREMRLGEKMDLLADEIRKLKAEEERRRAKQGMLAAMGGGLIALGMLALQAFGLWK
jgi:hypothetical protein